MPSFRMHLPVGTLHDGVHPMQLMEQAALALGSRHVVEKQDVEAPILDGHRVARIVLRFEVPAAAHDAEDDAARSALEAVCDHLATLCELEPASALLLTRTTKGARPLPLSR